MRILWDILQPENVCCPTDLQASGIKNPWNVNCVVTGDMTTCGDNSDVDWRPVPLQLGTAMGRQSHNTGLFPAPWPNLNPYIPDSKINGANMGPIWGRQDPGGPHVGPMNFVSGYVFRNVHPNAQLLLL